MTSIPASRSARAMTLAPRSWPSNPGLAIRTRMGRDIPECECISPCASVDDRHRIADPQAIARDGTGADADQSCPPAQDRGEDSRRALRRVRVEARHDGPLALADDLQEHVADPDLPPDPAVLLEGPAVGKVQHQVRPEPRRLERAAVLLLDEADRLDRKHVERSDLGVRVLA